MNNTFLNNLKISKDTIQLTDKVTFDSEDLEEVIENNKSSSSSLMKIFIEKEKKIKSAILEYINEEEFLFLMSNDLITECFSVHDRTLDIKMKRALNSYFNNKPNEYSFEVEFYVIPHEENLEKHLQKFRIQQKIKGF